METGKLALILLTVLACAALAAAGLIVYGRAHPCEGCLEQLERDVVDGAERAAREAAE